jgi:hypothetical protein
MNSTSASSTGNWFDLFLKSNEISIDRFSANAGGGHLARPGSSKPGKITLHKRFVKGEDGTRQLTGFKVSYWPWQLRSFWDGIILTLVGQTDVPPISGLSNVGTPDAWQKDIQNAAFANLVATLQDENLIDPSTGTKKDYKRLEALFPVADGGALVVDIVRIILLPKATMNSETLALVNFATVGGDMTGQQNGGGSGPPH